MTDEPVLQWQLTIYVSPSRPLPGRVEMERILGGTIFNDPGWGPEVIHCRFDTESDAQQASVLAVLVGWDAVVSQRWTTLEMES